MHTHRPKGSKVAQSIRIYEILCKLIMKSVFYKLKRVLSVVTMSSSLLHGDWMHRYAGDSNLFSNIPKTMNECDVCNVHVSHDNKHPSTSNEHMNWKMLSFSWHQCKHEGRREESGTNSWKIDMFKCEMRIGWMWSFLCVITMNAKSALCAYCKYRIHKNLLK